ncbi:unnamed protein product [Trifolium pratense]|uniref:Uncharacterized protein n=1 Tax=Trifolium pratense TaxID=57577 RepID=A0ACB0K6N6_TRIPR|nr:unnamed protein product [Trifolium pratense]
MANAADVRFKLNTGAEIPALGLGTWQSDPGLVKDASRAEEALDKSLKSLGLDYLDLYLVHWPLPMNPNGNNDLAPKLPDGSYDIEKDWTHVQTWKSMEKLVKTNKVKAIGVSNYSKLYLEELLPQAEIIPAVNQIENHPSLPQQDVVDYCKEKGIHITAYSPLGSTGTPLMKEPIIVELAEKKKVTPASILLSYHLSFSKLETEKERVTTNGFYQIHGLRDAGKSHKEIANQLKISLRQVGYALLRGNVTPKKRKGRSPILSSEDVDQIENLVKSSPINRRMIYLELAAGPFRHLGVSEKDNAPPHAAARTMEEMEEKVITPISWPPNSPDLNPIEAVWDNMKNYIQLNYQSLGSGKKRSRDRLRLVVKQAWDSVSSEYSVKLIGTMPASCKAVIDADGGPTKY